MQKSNFEIRIPKPNFDTKGIPLFNKVLEESNEDPRNKHALMVLLTNCTKDVCLEEPKTLKEALSSLERSQWLVVAKAEVQSLQTKGVYYLVDQTLGMKILGGK